MDILTSNELESMGVLHDRSTKIVFQGDEFTVGPSFSKNNKGISINFCTQEEKNGCRCLLVESSSAVTVWKCVNPTKEKLLEQDLSRIKKEKLLGQCRLELTKCIGPIATLIIDEIEDEINNMPRIKFIDMIAEQIPDPKIALAFKKNMN
jgi:hypothetical protein